MTFKKVLSAVMAGAMVLSMGLTAFAAAPSGVELEGEEGYEIQVGTATQAATIKVKVPETVGFVVNPYRLDVKNEELGITDTSKSQIVSPIQKIENLSAFKLTVGGTIYAVENSEEAKLTKAAFTTGTDGNPKEANISFDYNAGAAADTSTTSPTSTNLADAKTEAGVALTDTELDAAGGANPAYVFQFSGSAQDDPATPWTEGDTFGATISFTFTAVANAAPSNP